jgi:hypothetical protein
MEHNFHEAIIVDRDTFPMAVGPKSPASQKYPIGGVIPPVIPKNQRPRVRPPPPFDMNCQRTKATFEM